MDSDAKFYARRAAEEFALANKSITPAAQDRHKKLAQEFAAKALKACEVE